MLGNCPTSIFGVCAMFSNSPSIPYPHLCLLTTTMQPCLLAGPRAKRPDFGMGVEMCAMLTRFYYV